MSFSAIDWAFKQKPARSTEKWVLTALANRAEKNTDLVWPSHKAICDDTLLNRKTVISCLQSLVDQNLIIDTGKRKGNTGHIKVYQLNVKAVPKTGQLEDAKKDENMPKTGALNDTENGIVEQSQKRNSPKNGTVPILPPNSPKSGTLKQSQKRDKEPVIKEPVINLSNTGPSPAPQKRKKILLPDDFKITQEMRDWAREKNIQVDLDEETEQFVDYQNTNQKTQADWIATWRNWMRNAKKYSRTTKTTNTHNAAPQLQALN